MTRIAGYAQLERFKGETEILQNKEEKAPASHNYLLAANFTFTGYSEDWSLELPATLLCPLYSSMKEKLETAHGPSTEIEKSFSPWKPGDAFSIDDMEIDNGQTR